MLEMDWLAVGDGEKSGDAIAARFTRADTGALAHIVVDAGFQDDGMDVVEVFDRYYGTRKVDLAILTHPDGDHIARVSPRIADRIVLRALGGFEAALLSPQTPTRPTRSD